MPNAGGVITCDEFMSYAHAKAFDVISAGHFKKHLSSCKENGDKWAINMYSDQSVVQNRVRELFAMVSQITSPQTERVQRVCKDVMSCAQPPVKVLTGYNTCSLTLVSAEHCIDLTRPGKNMRPVFAHPRFRHFFMLLWYCAKIEYVIRAWTKQWMETRGTPIHPDTYTQMCEEYTLQNQQTIQNLYLLFVKGFDYVIRSLEGVRKTCAIQPALSPSAEYLSRQDNDTEDVCTYKKEEVKLQEPHALEESR